MVLDYTRLLPVRVDLALKSIPAAPRKAPTPAPVYRVPTEDRGGTVNTTIPGPVQRNVLHWSDDSRRHVRKRADTLTRTW